MFSISIKISNHADERIGYLTHHIDKGRCCRGDELFSIIPSNGTSVFEAELESSTHAGSGSIVYDVDGERFAVYWNYNDPENIHSHHNSYWATVSNTLSYRCEPSSPQEFSGETKELVFSLYDIINS